MEHTEAGTSVPLLAPLLSPLGRSLASAPPDPQRDEDVFVPTVVVLCAPLCVRRRVCTQLRDAGLGFEIRTSAAAILVPTALAGFDVAVVAGDAPWSAAVVSAMRSAVPRMPRVGVVAFADVHPCDAFDAVVPLQAGGDELAVTVRRLATCTAAGRRRVAPIPPARPAVVTRRA